MLNVSVLSLLQKENGFKTEIMKVAPPTTLDFAGVLVEHCIQNFQCELKPGSIAVNRLRIHCENAVHKLCAEIDEVPINV